MLAIKTEEEEMLDWKLRWRPICEMIWYKVMSFFASNKMLYTVFHTINTAKYATTRRMLLMSARPATST